MTRSYSNKFRQLQQNSGDTYQLGNALKPMEVNPYDYNNKGFKPIDLIRPIVK